MKKLLMMAMALLLSGTLLAQGSKVKGDSKSFIAFHGGPSFPIADFSSTDMTNNANAGFAKTGFVLNLSYGYEIKNNFGLTAGLLYNKYDVDSKKIVFTDPETHDVIPVNLDHWQFYGVTAGPMYTFKAGNKVKVDLKVMGGIVNANAPLIQVLSLNITNDAWHTAPVLQAGVNFRMGVGKKMFIMTSADYLYLDPTFKYTYTDIISGVPGIDRITEEFHQKMNIINVTAGIGFKF
ncbi:MAG: outer membrane beta-barrel protein [Chitinophagaceae bacterium]|nr:outer membrane beta-barrel protein [Chitinophagaceae bacterium]